MLKLLTDQDEMSNLYRGLSIDTSYQVSVHLAKQFQRRFKKIGQSETRITWPPQAILVFDWLVSKKIFSSKTAFPNELKGR
jgi:hypothetical protein